MKTIALMLFLNIGLISVLIYIYLFNNEKKELAKLVYDINDNEAKPFVVFNGDKVDVTFIDPSFNIDGNEGAENSNYNQKRKKIVECKPYLKEYLEDDTLNNNPEITNLGDFPSYIPNFKEKANAKGYEYDPKVFEERTSNDWGEYNPLRILGHYDHEVAEDKYNANPTITKEFETPNLGLVNDPNYCDAHDVFLLNHPEAVLQKMYFLSDYHQFSIPRSRALSVFGKDTNSKVCKNMRSVNYHQRLYPVDLKTSIFYFKFASFHHYHELGKHFGCWGQSYNHIPGHGHLVRKDLLVTSANDYIKRYKKAGEEECFKPDTYFPISFRLYDKEECQAYFKYISTEEHKKESKVSQVQFVLKVGFGVHRGAGVYLVDSPVENNLKANYSNGALCGKIDENLITQKYIYDVMTIDNEKGKGGYKFDFRIYMMVVSVDPLIVYYHDGFLRVSLFRYSLDNLDYKAHLTNTELAKEIFKKVEDGGYHEGMNSEQLREFQMRTMEQFQEYLETVDPVKYKNFVNTTLRTEFRRSYLHLAKMIQNKVEKRPNLFEVYGVDFIIDSNDKIYIIEVNPSPMMVGTSEKKTSLMTSMNQGILKLSMAYLRSRVKRTHAFITKNMKQIKERKELGKLKKEFNALNRNYLEPEFEKALKDLSWMPVFDQNKKGTPGYVNGLISDKCVKAMEKVDKIE